MTSTLQGRRRPFSFWLYLALSYLLDIFDLTFRRVTYFLSECNLNDIAAFCGIAVMVYWAVRI